MTKELLTNFFNVVEEMKLKSYYICINSTWNRFINNGENSIVKYDGNETICCIKGEPTPSTSPFQGNVRAYVTHMNEINEFRVGGSYKDVKDFVEKMGFTLSDQDIKIMLEINNKNTKLIPVTGDYSKFKKLTQEEFDELTPAQQEQYKKDYQIYENMHEANQSFVAQIDV
jgi:hypothetical protein